MRGPSDHQQSMFIVFNIEERVPADHPLRQIKQQCDVIFGRLRRDFNAAYSHTGRPSIPPEQLLKAMLLQSLYSIRSEIQLMQAIDFNLLYRWFIDLPPDRPVWVPETFSVNRQRFHEHGLVQKFFDQLVHDAIAGNLVSSDHFSADGTLIRSWASVKSLAPRNGEREVDDDDPGNPTVNYRQQQFKNDTHVSRTDPEARLMKKGKGQAAYLSHSGHVLMENRHGLCLAVGVDAADGKAERKVLKQLLQRAKRRHRLRPRTLGLDAGYGDGAFLLELEALQIKPHAALKHDKITDTSPAGQARRRAQRRRRTAGYQISQRVRKRVEEIFGWMKTIGGLARTKYVGRWKIQLQMLMSATAYNLLRMARLKPTP